MHLNPYPIRYPLIALTEPHIPSTVPISYCLEDLRTNAEVIYKPTGSYSMYCIKINRIHG